MKLIDQRTRQRAFSTISPCNIVSWKLVSSSKHAFRCCMQSSPVNSPGLWTRVQRNMRGTHNFIHFMNPELFIFLTGRCATADGLHEEPGMACEGLLGGPRAAGAGCSACSCQAPRLPDVWQQPVPDSSEKLRAASAGKPAWMSFCEFVQPWCQGNSAPRQHLQMHNQLALILFESASQAATDSVDC